MKNIIKIIQPNFESTLIITLIASFLTWFIFYHLSTFLPFNFPYNCYETCMFSQQQHNTLTLLLISYFVLPYLSLLALFIYYRKRYLKLKPKLSLYDFSVVLMLLLPSFIFQIVITFTTIFSFFN